MDTDVLEEPGAKRKIYECAEYSSFYNKISDVYPKLRNADINALQNSFVLYCIYFHPFLLHSNIWTSHSIMQVNNTTTTFTSMLQFDIIISNIYKCNISIYSNYYIQYIHGYEVQT
jgi:hypothetical protein